MGLTVKDKGGVDIAPVPTGMHHGICYGIVDIGTQPAFGQYPARRKVILLFEFPEIRIELPDREDKKKMLNLPRALSITETASLSSKANLRKILEGWRGRVFTPQELEGFDLKNILKANALINVVHAKKDGKTFANIQTVNPLAKGMKRLEPEQPPLFFSFDDVPAGRPIEIPERTPDWIKGKIMQSDEYITRMQKGGQPPRDTGSHEAATDENDEDLPF